MVKKILFILCVFGLLSGNIAYVSAAQSTTNSAYTNLREVDLGTFNEYRYRITEKFFTLRNDFEVSGIIKESTIVDIYSLSKDSYNYVPDNLINKNLYEKLEIALARAAKYPGNENVYLELVEGLDNYLEDVRIQSVKGTIKATPDTGNAPLSVTMRGEVRDETGTQIPEYNYVWWISEGGKRKIIGNRPSINYVFREEGTFSVFLDVTSAHRNAKGFTDVLPFSSRTDITIKEKVASLIIKVNSDNLRDKDELKFTPQEAAYGLIFDATSSTPTDGARFSSTEWDFGNGITRTNRGDPEVERVKFTREGEYTVKLKLRTNENKTVERDFIIDIHDPIATVNASKEQGFLGEKFTFSAQPTGSDDDLSYDWEIIDIDYDEQIFTKSGKTFTYTFDKKGKYNVRLRVTEPSGEIDIDTQIIYINSRAPVADFTHKIPFPHQPNTVLLDASKSYDLDGIDDGKLNYEWVINGEIVTLDNASFNGSVGYYTFDTAESHSVLLRVTDPEGIPSQETDKVEVRSILSVDFGAYPRVTQRGLPISFQADSPEATVYNWNFGDGNSQTSTRSNISHIYEKSGVYNVKLEVSDRNDNTNTYTRKVYIGESANPVAFISVKNSQNNEIGTQPGLCYGNAAYVVDRAGSVNFNASESIDITGKPSGITYSWKLAQNKYFSGNSFTQQFDELGCFPVQLTVTSNKNGRTDKVNTWVKVENLAPTLSSVDVQIVDATADPVIVKVSALGAKDEDGVIQSYLWYYYTDIDPEPQDFRATKQSNTTFVLPKVTGNYYFVVLMKDNNETRISSEEITGSKYFITLTGDNINVPLVDLRVDDSSISVGQEVVFRTEVENILGTNLSNKAEYSWDLDGDGFYEQKTNTPTVTYVYKKSGEFYAKVKAKYKGYSNTKSISMNVSNILKPQVEYISIGNKFVIFDTSIGKSDKITWDLGDGETVKDERQLIKSFEGNAGSYEVSMTLEEGIKKETESFILKKNVRNLIEARKKGLIIFSNKEIKENIITLEDETDSIYLYLGESQGEDDEVITDFDIDTNIDFDSDLNGGKDDDNDISILFGQSNNIVKISLNDLREQNIVITARDVDENELYSRQILIQKNYIEETEIDINSINFTGISQAEAEIIEKLKSEIKNLPKENRLKSLMYIQKLQEEWFDASEKTKVIIEFEGYLLGIDSTNTDPIYSLLQELLLQNEDDKSEKNLMFVALRDLTPTNIECDLSTDSENNKCYNAILERLNIIKVNANVEENKLLGKEILQVIEVYPEMTNADKQNFKAILSSFIYGGVDDVPEDERQAEIDTPNIEKPKANGDGSAILIVLKTIAYIFLIIIGIFFGIFILFFLAYKIFNRDDNLGFQDYIIEKTSGKKKKIVVQKDEAEDILNELGADLGEKEELNTKKIEQEVKEKKENINNEKDPLGNIENEDSTSKTKEIQTNKEDVPAWLKGSFSEENKENKKENNSEKTQQNNNQKSKFQSDKNTNRSQQGNKSQRGAQGNLNKKTSEEVPDWLKGTITEDDMKTSEKKDTEKKNIPNKQLGSSDTKTKKQEVNNKDSQVPDWLKGTIPEENNETNKNKETNSQNTDSVKSENNSDSGKKLDTKEDIEKVTEIKKEEKQDIPDWLKGSFDDKDKDKNMNDTNEKQKSDDGIPDWLKGSFDEKEEDKNKKDIKKESQSDDKKRIKQKGNEGSDTGEKEEDKVDSNEPIKVEQVQKKGDSISDNKKMDNLKDSTKNNNDTISDKKEESSQDKKDKKVLSSEGNTNIEKSQNGEKGKEETVNVYGKSEDNKGTKEKVSTSSFKKELKTDSVEKKGEESKVGDEKKSDPSGEKKPTTANKKSLGSKNKQTNIKKDEENAEKNKTKTENDNTGKKQKEDELWDDGMKIPDWLKTDDDK